MLDSREHEEITPSTDTSPPRTERLQTCEVSAPGSVPPGHPARVRTGGERRSKLDLRRVTLVCIETRYASLADFALQRCLAHADFGDVILFGPERSATGRGVRLVCADSLVRDAAERSEFVLKKLASYIETDFALIVPWDGFILDPSAWREEFLQYDHIGVPPAPGRREEGSFTLRSRRLLLATQAAELSQTHPEALCLNTRYRDRLESDADLRFAPPEVSERFVLSSPGEGGAADGAGRGGAKRARSFGFDGLQHFHRALGATQLQVYLQRCPTELLRAPQGRALAVALIEAGHHPAAQLVLRQRRGAGLAAWLDSWRLGIRSAVAGLLPPL